MSIYLRLVHTEHLTSLSSQAYEHKVSMIIIYHPNKKSSYQDCEIRIIIPISISESLDIDECQNATLVLECVENSTCVDTDGSFVCNCDDDFEGDGRIECRSEYLSTCTCIIM